jgi:putative transposase
MKNQLPQRKNIRLSPEVYKNRIIHIIICTREKTPLFANKDIAYSVKRQILNLSRLKQVKIYAYVIMPDHIHLLVSLGVWATPGDYLRDIKGNLSTFLRKEFDLRNIWQKGFYDHVMRKDEDLNSTVEYILNNPVRSGEFSHWSNYPWCGSDVFKT